MDRNIMSNPTFEEHDDDVNTHVTMLHFFGANKAITQAQHALNDRIDQVAFNLREFETRTREYLDTKLSSQMEELRSLMVTRAPSSSTSTRSHHTSRNSTTYSSDASPQARHHDRSRRTLRPKFSTRSTPSRQSISWQWIAKSCPRSRTSPPTRTRHVGARISTP